MQDVVQIALDVDVLRDVVLVEGEMGVALQVGDVFQVAGDEVVHGLDLEPLGDEAVAQVRTQKPCGPGDEYALHQAGCTVERPMLL